MSNNKQTTSGGLAFGSLLLLAFIILKLCNIINWSWWWVISPLWIPLCIVAIIFLAWIAMQLIKK